MTTGDLRAQPVFPDYTESDHRCRHEPPICASGDISAAVDRAAPIRVICMQASTACRCAVDRDTWRALRPLSSASSVPTPPGRYLILYAAVGSAQDNGRIDHGRLVPLTPANGPRNFEPFAAAADEAV